MFRNDGLSRLGRAVLAILIVGLAAPSTRAQEPSASDKAVAEALFREARQLLQDGQTSKACEKFEASYHVDRALGALLNLAICHEKEGRTASAWAEFNLAATRANQQSSADRERFARQRAAALEARLSRVMIRVEHPADRIEVKLDGKPLETGVWGSAIPLDPGQHTVEANAPARQRWERTFEVPAGPATTQIGVPALASEGGTAPAPVATGSSVPASSTEPPASALPPAAPAQSVVPPSDEPVAGPGRTGRGTWGWAMLGLGAVGLGAGTYFGIRTFQQQDIVDTECTGSICNPTGDQADRRAHEAATISTVAFGVGAAVAGVGLYLLLTDGGRPEPDATLRVEPVVGVQGAGAAMSGTF